MNETASLPTAETATETAPEPLLSARGLRRTYRLPRRRLLRPAPVRQALRGVDLEVREGGSLGIVGESGAGKSTLIRLLLGLDRADAGQVLYRGREVAGGGRPRDLAWFRREVQFVPQDPLGSLDPRMRVRDIVAEPLECLADASTAADGKAGRDRRIDEVLHAVGLDAADVRRRYPHEFSGGQRQRIAIARALAPRPRLLIADEPVSALDVSVRVQVLDLLRDLTARLGLALVLVSHDLGVVQLLCEEVLVLKDGRVEEQGPAEAVLRAPRSGYTRELLASVPSLAADPVSAPRYGPTR
ncbi:ABC transporter ATP-binding protein [Yinghuangia soli]|uniref:ATP-binding cassette domain-containing protein n=1 Tax=Yinghuangia soli TaxID=2908204 RepID=A0AA41PY27_9ACTN|nr:ABC transporter ATP-binding protein [Yinghuangia soli]MCF2527301.1 ATP-binding cassette domain-containing protein [Yinghuangia soli]